MKYSWIIYIIILLGVILGHIALSGSHNQLLASVNLLVIFSVLFINFLDFPLKVLFSVVGGFILDVYSNLPFGSFMIVLLIISVSLEILFYNFFTNRSLYSLLILGLIGVTIYDASFVLISGFSYLAGWNNFFIGQNYFWQYLKQLAVNSLLLFLSFYVLNYFSRKFKLFMQ
jgi:hypothetical protein